MTSKRSTRLAGAASLAAVSPLILTALAAPANADTPDQVERPATFTSAFIANGTPDQVFMGSEPAPGQPGATGTFKFLINTDLDVICWDMTTNGVDNDFVGASPAKTANHLHDAPAGMQGPPRIAFPDLTGDGDTLTSSGCSAGPFTTHAPGNPNEAGSSTGFELSDIEEDPSGYYANIHTNDFRPGAVRGQLVADPAGLAAANAQPATPAPSGGVRTGEGGAASTLPMGLLAAAAVAGLGVTGAVALRRRQGA
ncbi:hypothetical protein HMPREF0063_11220 [Aeromicrobium marinum DSM 15272]|uniref:CHRD domain-containing protein n=1 Tax=Aeromicrobium marinum DSM 15272 TaxID=585531 RepID=E2SB11_9ACTN|nr:CHRD domain-containing protein [Aeromicrobium marinum]EFQ83557.1 hypothetical protein HMPREF0063_11220 [Aeromicrobium marinum DSM 15272]